MLLLENTPKPDRREEMGVSLGVDLSRLDVCFGGFSPTIMKDATAAVDSAAVAEARLAKRRAAKERAAAIESARESELRSFQDDEGCRWSYVLIDGARARIERCEQAAGRLAVPASIEGRPVVGLAADACSHLPEVQELMVPDTVESIGPCAFRGCTSLREALLPANLAFFDSDWFRGCSRLERLRLPGGWDVLDARIFDLAALRRLEIGAGTFDVAPGAFAKSQLESVEVSAANPFMESDGAALYSRGRIVMAALAVPCTAYEVAAECRAVAKKGLSGFEGLQEVVLPEGIEVIGPFALARTGIERFEAPQALRELGEKAFFHCSRLRRVRLNPGLAIIGSQAFAGTDISELRVPSTVQQLGNPLAHEGALRFSGPEATFSIEGDDGCLRLDEAGGLYRRMPQGEAFLRLMDPCAERYEVAAGTTLIEKEAFASHGGLREVQLPEGLAAIGSAAFRGCRSLARADLPDGLREVGDEAFLDTALEELRLPASLERIGTNALVTYGAHHGKVAPSLRKVEVDAANGRFYAAGPLLLEHKPDGGARVLAAVASESVRIPDEVDEVAPYALSGLEGIRELHLSERIRLVGIRGLAVQGRVDLIDVRLCDPVEGHEGFEVRFPDTDRSRQQQMLALSVPSRVDAATILEHYDNAIVNASSFDAEAVEGLSVYEQAVRLLERMADPVLMTSVNRSMADRVLKSHIGPICIEVAKHDDRRTIDALMSLGYVNAENLCAIIDAVGVVQDAAMTSYLIEAQRVRFGLGARDFEL